VIVLSNVNGECVFSALWKALYIETLRELQVLSMVTEINEEIASANVCEGCIAFHSRY